MDLVSGTLHDGHVELGAPVDWPEVTQVEVKRRSPLQGMSEEDWPRKSEGIQALLALWDQIEPLYFTDEKRADFDRARREMGQRSMDKLDTEFDETLSARHKRGGRLDRSPWSNSRSSARNASRWSRDWNMHPCIGRALGRG